MKSKPVISAHLCGIYTYLDSYNDHTCSYVIFVYLQVFVILFQVVVVMLVQCIPLETDLPLLKIVHAIVAKITVFLVDSLAQLNQVDKNV